MYSLRVSNTLSTFLSNLEQLVKVSLATCGVLGATSKCRVETRHTSFRSLLGASSTRRQPAEKTSLALFSLAFSSKARKRFFPHEQS